jgi:short-subunit dehydrogenase
VVVAKVDAGNSGEMSSLFKQFGNELPVLRGLFHAAAAGEASSLADLSLEKIDEMFHAKVTGSWLLHQLTKELELECFVLFSSTTALLGVSDLAHYAAANCFLDSLAAYRHAAGLPAISINWGTWGEADEA